MFFSPQVSGGADDELSPEEVDWTDSQVVSWWKQTNIKIMNVINYGFVAQSLMKLHWTPQFFSPGPGLTHV